MAADKNDRSTQEDTDKSPQLQDDADNAVGENAEQNGKSEDKAGGTEDGGDETGGKSAKKLKWYNVVDRIKNPVLREIASWAETIFFAVICAFIITHVFIVNARVPSASMETTIMTGDKLIANRLSYVVSDPQRFDIVVFKFPDDPEQKTLYIKRIIGLPGEKVEIRDNQIYINDSAEPLDDSFIKEPMYTKDAVYEVPEDCYFMMGDNRNNSADSRFWQNKFVSSDKILGKAVFRYWPLDQMGTIKDGKKKISSTDKAPEELFVPEGYDGYTVEEETNGNDD